MHTNNLDKYYFISECDTNLINNQDSSTNIIYRNYNKKVNIKKILELKNFCKKKGNKLFLSNDIKLAMNLGLDGVYLPSFNRSYQHLLYSFKKNFKIIGSAHSIKELKNKENQKVQVIFLSSIFKRNNNYLGVNKFKILQRYSKIKVIALGGVNEKNIKLLSLINVSGFAGITYFQKKRPL
tara:strand:+ start:428 stop:970 length:543 start_codon:yes stop_codon:yes gene_type:complete